MPVTRGVDDPIHNIHPLRHHTERCILAIQMRGIFRHDEKLAAGRVRRHGTRHGKYTARMVQVVLESVCGELAADLIARAAHTGAFRVAALDHKARDHAVKDRPIIKSLLDQRNEIANCIRSHVRIQLCPDYAALLHLDRNNRIVHF